MDDGCIALYGRSQPSAVRKTDFLIRKAEDISPFVSFLVL
jgi:hypothetical protein